jgi:hypothetical protein
MKTEVVKISKIKKNPNNPRLVKDDKFKKLVQSIKDFPEMLKIRPIVVNEHMVVLGGNMRLRACKDAGLKDVPIIQASELTEKQQREFIIKDNVGFGEWDWDMIANEWDAGEMNQWGVDVWQPEEEVDYSVLEDLDLSSTLQDKEQSVKRAIQIEFNAEHYDEAFKLISESRNQGKDVGWITLQAFRSEL